MKTRPLMNSTTRHEEHRHSRESRSRALPFGFAPLALALTCGSALAQAPNGFALTASDTGVAMYTQQVAGGAPDYVVSVDLRNAELRSTVGPVVAQRRGQGPLGGDNPTITRRSLRDFWNAEAQNNNRTFAVVNGQLFSTAHQPTSLAFGLHADGRHVSDGYGVVAEFPNQKMLLTWGGQAARLRNFRPQDFSANGGDADRLVGLNVAANKDRFANRPRTFIGTADRNNDGRDETLLIFVSSLATQAYAAGTLRDFGASEVMMLDGGGSTQLIVEGNDVVRSGRTIPHALVVVAGAAGGCPHPPGHWDYCLDCGPCPAGAGDCEDGQCAAGLVCTQNVGADYGWDNGVDVCEAPGGGGCPHPPGHWDYCLDCGPCPAGAGDCENGQCAAGLVCEQNVGANYGWDNGVDVCEAPAGGGGCPHPPGHWDYCLDCGPCPAGAGDCEIGQCAAGLICAQNVGADYGWDNGVDVCEAANAGCPHPPGHWDYCLDCGPCPAGAGDCENGQCATGLICTQNVGADYGWGDGVDVCEAPGGGGCPHPPGHWNYCRDCGPCSAGRGDCEDGQCAAGLICARNVGARYGWDGGVDVCERP